MEETREQFGILALNCWNTGPNLVDPGRSQNSLVATGLAYQPATLRVRFLFLAVTKSAH